MKKFIATMVLLSAHPIKAQNEITPIDFERIKEHQFSAPRKCDPEKVLHSSEKLSVEPFYLYDGEEKKPLDKETNKRLLCLIGISTDIQLRGHLKSKPKNSIQALEFKGRWPENAIVEEILFGPPKKFNLRCDDDGVPSVILEFTKKDGKLVRTISFTTSVLDCGAGELDNWLKPRPAWLK